MPDYEKMYYTLFNKITNIIEELEQAQQETEEMYIEFKEQKIEIKRNEEKGKEPDKVI